MIIVRDVFSLSVMNHNFIPPFAIRDVDINVRIMPKIQEEDLSIDDYSAHFTKENLMTLLNFNGLISYFTSRKKLLVAITNESDQKCY